MKNYLPKNQNEFNYEGKRYVEKICSCRCEELFGGFYKLDCKIHQRGSHLYNYKSGDDFISRDGYKKLYLSDSAMDTVTRAVSEFETEAAKTREWREIKVPLRDSFISIRYKLLEDGNIEYYHEYGKNEKSFYRIYDPLHSLLCKVGDLICRENVKFSLSEWHDMLLRSTETTIAKNPIYQAAVVQNDELFAMILKLYYGIADDDECSYLSDYLGCRILPSLPEEYDRNYVVERSDVDYTMLNRSGYRIFHRPAMAMHGYTHSKITLNPHVKEGVDAARIDDGSISFNDYLNLFVEECCGNIEQGRSTEE